MAMIAPAVAAYVNTLSRKKLPAKRWISLASEDATPCARPVVSQKTVDTVTNCTHATTTLAIA